ncbi:tRNA1(Val) (adenine(37)-N6)-methyltransferase [Kaistella palustris]|uniref:tRNA1(Val) (adenine(37)-N6)-methyltransferase n=1 Tax=Kaistella palustris TaxID=493376 RepID=UPI0004213802|nr:methyltransferase [Kaistella palustris]
MKPFHFQQFSLQQNQNVFRVGTDGVLLGAMASVENAPTILEVGTGTGLISLMVAQRNGSAKIVALDIDNNAVSLAAENFKNSPFTARLSAQTVDYRDFETVEEFSHIISNPPYFEQNSSIKDITARQQTQLSFNTLIKKTATLLKSDGRFSVIIPFEAGLEFEKLCVENGLHAFRKIKISGLKDSKPKRWILEFSKKPGPCNEAEFTIEKSARRYSDEYLELTKDFHLFGKR